MWDHGSFGAPYPVVDTDWMTWPRALGGAYNLVGDGVNASESVAYSLEATAVLCCPFDFRSSVGSSCPVSGGVGSETLPAALSLS